MMKTLRIGTLAALVLASASCKDFLDVNDNPNAPQTVSANLYLAPMLHWMTTSPQYDGRFVGRYAQEWTLASGVTSLSTWDRMGYDPASDNGAQQWRDVYWTFGQNLVDMMNKAEAEQRWDLLGVGYVLKAWGWQVLTDLHGEIIIKEAIDQSKFTFNYDTQEYAYSEILRLLDKAIELLGKSDGAVDQAFLARTDKIYNGDRAKWTKLAYGMKALALNHFSNKSSYKPAEVISNVDKSLASNADEPLLTYPGTQNDDINFWGRTRGNIQTNTTGYRQTQFIVNLMNGTYTGGTVDPRMSRMLAPSPDGQYRGLDVNVIGFGALTAAQQPNNFHGYVGTGGLQSPGRYIFDDKAKLAVMTYAQLQFIKAEAAYRSGDKATALTAYRNAVSAHFDWVNARNSDNGQTPTQITSAEKTAYMNVIVPAAASALTLTHIMSQKYIAQWGWGHNEIWMDLRRYHYTDIDPASGIQVFPGFTPPTNLYPDNGGKIVQRIRARYNSEYVWNRAALETIGGLALDFHTKPLWIIEP
ncbi:MAG: RagB/SusD family nutrient uptake outer membrane protein [Gemmatimonadaceae bacterium]|nr:RagB/SusD family nutrient uptake outer membrane protein [Gemmatimonadaceae bacterium]